MGEMTKININDRFAVRLMNDGYEELVKAATIWEDRSTGVKYAEVCHPEQPDGTRIFQLHELMRFFGPLMFNGNNNLPFETTIEYLGDGLSGMAEPVAWAFFDRKGYEHFLRTGDRGFISDISVVKDFVEQKSRSHDVTIPLYAATPPASGLREENERLRKALETIAETEPSGHLEFYQPKHSGYAALEIARAALQTEGK